MSYRLKSPTMSSGTTKHQRHSIGVLTKILKQPKFA